MSTEALELISAAEESARRAVADARQSAKKAVSDAEADGAAIIDAAIAEAQTEVKILLAAADAKARENEEELQSSVENKCAALRAHAETRLDAAASLIVERIVNG